MKNVTYHDIVGYRPGMENTSGVLRETVAPEDVGHAVLVPNGEIEAGSWQTLTLVYTAGKFGIDDSGALRVCWRHANDQTPPQFTDPAGPGFTKIKASNDAVLEYHYDIKGNVRPFDRCLYIRIVNGFLRKGDTITVIFGDRSDGSPGMRMQTFCQENLEFRVLVDPIATVNFQTLPRQPTIKIVAGAAHKVVAQIPTLRRVDEQFTLKIKHEDIWGNPTSSSDAIYRLRANIEIANLPETIKFSPGKYTVMVDGLSVSKTNDVKLDLLDLDGNIAATANASRIVAASDYVHYWADLHGQSEETIGTNTAEQYFEFARDKAFIDACCHQGNDFQITNEFWEHLNEITQEFDQPGTFLAIPGYEWSGNTGLGGDRNVMFLEEGRTIRRSSHALLEDRSDVNSDCHTAADLFRALAENGEWDCSIIAHCGGRYADIKVAHDGRFENTVEVHSSWGTFEWLLYDAFDLGYRVGIVCNSDGHKGRPGASYPGAGIFGAIGGLTCYPLKALTRDDIFEALSARRHYGTTGGPSSRMFIDVSARFDQERDIYDDDPNLGPSKSWLRKTATMGNIVHLPEGGLDLDIDILTSSPIERIEIFNGKELIETIRAFDTSSSSHRIRLYWEGAKYRGRFRQLVWDGHAEISSNVIERISPVNFFNPNRSLNQDGKNLLRWNSVTTGNFAGADIWLKNALDGTLRFRSPVLDFDLPVAEIGFEDSIFDVSGTLPIFVKVFRLPELMNTFKLKVSRRIDNLSSEKDNPLFIRLTQEDGVRAWTSPIYISRKI